MKKHPGEMIHIDIKMLGRIEEIRHRITKDRAGQSAPRSRKESGKGWEYLHLAVDDHSRLAYSEILPDETRRSRLKFLFNALRFFRDHGVKALRVMTDKGVSFRSHRSAKALRMLKIKHKRTRPYTPKGRTLRADLLAGMGLCQTLPPFLRAGRRTVAIPPPLQSSSASLRHQREKAPPA